MHLHKNYVGGWLNKRQHAKHHQALCKVLLILIILFMDHSENLDRMDWVGLDWDVFVLF